MIDQGFLLSLRHWVVGPDWCNLCSSSRSSLAFRAVNAELVYKGHGAMCPPSGCTFLQITFWQTGMEMHLPNTIKKMHLTCAVYLGLPPVWEKMVLPKYLVHLHLLCVVSTEFAGMKWPKTLRTLELEDVLYNAPAPNFPSGIRKLRTQGSVLPVKIPDSVRTLECQTGFSSQADCTKFVLPIGLRKMHLLGRALVDFHRVEIPTSLTYLHLDINSLCAGHYGNFSGISRQIRFCTGLKHLGLCGWFNDPVIGMTLPQSLETLVLGSSFDQPVENWVLPDGLLELRIGDRFNQPVENWVLPETLKILEMGDSFDKPVFMWVLPPKLQRLAMGRRFASPGDFWAVHVPVKTFKREKSDSLDNHAFLHYV